MKIKAIITDVGGVLVRELNQDSRVFWENKLHLTREQLITEVYRTGVAKLATIGKADYETIWQAVQSKFSLTETEVKQMEQDFHAGDQLNAKFYSFMHVVHKQYQTALLSNTWLNARQIYTEKYHLDAIVDEMIISAEEGIRKPNKKIFRIAMERLHVRPDETIYIDDRADNIKTAKALGMHTVQFAHTQDAIDRIQKLL